MRPFNDFLDVELHLSIADRGSVRLAAAACGISQPAASRRLRLMERRVGAPLYELGPRGARLSAAGTFWEAEARELLARLNGATTRFNQEFAPGECRLKIAAAQVVADYLLPSWLQSWMSLANDRFCDVEIGNYSFVQACVRRGDVELGLLELTGETPDELESVPLLTDRLVLVVGRSHALASRTTPIELDELARIPLIQREAGSGTLMTVKRMLAADGLRLRSPAIEVGSLSAVKSAVAQGVAPGILPRLSVEEEIAAGKLFELPIAEMDFVVVVHVVYRPVRTLSRAARTFIARVQESVASG